MQAGVRMFDRTNMHSLFCYVTPRNILQTVFQLEDPRACHKTAEVPRQRVMSAFDKTFVFFPS